MNTKKVHRLHQFYSVCPMRAQAVPERGATEVWPRHRRRRRRRRGASPRRRTQSWATTPAVSETFPPSISFRSSIIELSRMKNRQTRTCRSETGQQFEIPCFCQQKAQRCGKLGYRIPDRLSLDDLPRLHVDCSAPRDLIVARADAFEQEIPRSRRDATARVGS